MKLHSYRLCRIIVSLTMVFCLLFVLCVPSHAVVGVDDAIIAGLIAALGSMGMDFFAQGLDRSGVVDEVTKWAEDNIGQLPENVQLALAAPNVLTIGGVLWNYAVSCADWFKSKFPSGSGTDNLLVPSAGGYSITDVDGNHFQLFDLDSLDFDSLSYPQPFLPVTRVYRGSQFNFQFGSVSFRIGPTNFGLEVPGSATGFGTFGFYDEFGQQYTYVGYSASSPRFCCLTYNTAGRFFSAASSSSVILPSDFSLTASSASDSSLDLVGTDVASPETVPDNKNMFLGLPSSFGSLPEFVDRVFDGVDSDSESGPLQSDYSSQLSDLIDVNGGILSNTNSIAQSASGILSGVQALVSDLVGFISELPGYIASLSGRFLDIWHYVVDWVNSLRPFLNSMFSIWQGLPVAMVLPVYATAVIVIVLGLYKRFFM